MRNWLEQHRFYWYSLSISFIPFFWHWEYEYDNHPGWFKWTCGPVGILIVKPFKDSFSDYPKEEDAERNDSSEA